MRMKRLQRIRTHELFVRKPIAYEIYEKKSMQNILKLQYSLCTAERVAAYL